MNIRVEVNNNILGNSVYWEGDANDINGIGNILAIITAKKVINDGKTRKKGMWTVSVLKENDKYYIRHDYKYGGMEKIYFKSLDKVKEWVKARININMRINQNTISLYKKLNKGDEYEHIEIPFSLERAASLRGSPTNDEHWDSPYWED